MSLNLDKTTWERVRFGDLVANVNDYFDPADDGVLPYIAGPHIDAGIIEPRYGRTDEVTFPPTFKRKFMSGDVLLHSRGIEKAAVVDRMGVTGEKLFVLRSKDETQLHPKFLPFLVVAPSTRRYMEANFSGSVNKFLNWTPLARLEFTLPPLAEQRRLADLLWAAEQHRRSLRGQVTDLETLSLTHSGATFTNWLARKSVPLETLYDFQLGKMLSATTQNDADELVPYVTNSNVYWRAVDSTEVREMRFKAAELQKFALLPGDVLACEARFVGRACVWAEQVPGAMYQKSLHRLRQRDGFLTPYALVEYLYWSNKTGRFKSIVGDNLIPHLPEVRFRKFLAPSPTEAEARAYQQDLDSLHAAAEGLVSEESALASLLQSATQEVFG